MFPRILSPGVFNGSFPAPAKFLQALFLVVRNTLRLRK
jgi:hypothetical protein